MEVDKFLNEKATRSAKLAMAFARWALLRGRDIRPDRPIPLRPAPSPIIDGLEVLEKGEGPALAEEGLVVGTVRMGYGHHRMAYSAYTWALAKRIPVYLHDLLAIDSDEARLIAGIDKYYSALSRLCSEFGGPVDRLWGGAMSRGDANSLRVSCMLAGELRALMAAIPNHLPMISSYPLNGQMAVACGFRRVVNLVPDNFPQHFLLVPGAMNLLQSPAAYGLFREMGVPAASLGVAGHWVSREIAENAKRDCEARIRRAAERRPRRILLPIGGAGAQRKYVSALLRAIAPKLARGEMLLFLNTGDHDAIFAWFKSLLEEQKVPFEAVESWKGLLEFCGRHELSGSEPGAAKPATVFHFASRFEAFAATERLMRVSDILATKPSELGFFPIPKLFFRRVGDHEAGAVLRAQELGEGTAECRDAARAERMLALLCDESDLFVRLNENIARNAERGIYDGSRRAVELAMSLP